MVFLVHGAMFGGWATQIPVVRERLGLDTATLGLALLCPALGGVVSMPFAAALGRRLGPLPLLRGSAALACLMLPLAVAASGVWMLGAVLLLFGAGLGLVDLVMNAQAVEVERSSLRPIMSGLHGMWSLGALLGAVLGGVLLALVSPVRQALLLAGLGGLLVLAVSAGMLPTGARQVSPGPMRIRRLMLRPALLLLGAMMALAFAVEGALLDWSAIFLRETHHVSRSAAGLGYAAFAGSTLLGRLGGDRARARWGDRRVLLGAMLSGLFLAAAVLAPGALLSVAGFALTGLMLCNVVPILFNTAGTFGAAAGPEGATQAVAAAVGCGYAGVMAAPPLFGLLARASSLSVALGAAALGCVMLGIVSRALPPMPEPGPRES